MTDTPLPSRDDAWALLCEYTQSESLRKHALAVEAVMRAAARRHGHEEHLWGLTGLLHDFDYERWPDPADHTVAGGRILRERGYPEELVHAIQAHNEANGLGLKREAILDQVLFANDELTGFITAVALVRPSRRIHEVEPKSVLKKLKDKRFAASVNRDEVRQGMEELGVEPAPHIQFIVDALIPLAAELGLAGSASGAGSPGE
jgi:putative nucleotidyltransferase with HDIG domain